jgi:hypothetical protein
LIVGRRIVVRHFFVLLEFFSLDLCALYMCLEKTSMADCERVCALLCVSKNSFCKEVKNNNYCMLVH